MKTLRLALCATLLLSACDFDVPNLNRPGLESLQTPTPSQVEALATGLIIGARGQTSSPQGISGRVGVVAEWGILGREALILTTSEPRFVSELLQSPSLDPGSPNFGGNFWVTPYSNIRNANLLLDALPNVAGLADADKEGMRGFAKTIIALDLLQVIDAHDTNGAVIARCPVAPALPIVNCKDADLTLQQFAAGQLPPIVGKDQVLADIAQLLDEAQAHLAADTSAKFVFPLGSGFVGFDTPPTFLLFNRALKARVEVYRGNFASALTALTASFLDTAASLNLGVFHAYGTGSGDTANTLNTTDILCHPSVVADAETLQTPPSGCTGLACLDNRVAAKVVKLAAPVTLSNHGSQYGFTLYPNSNSPIPIIRNEELILLRAEANIGLVLAGTGGNLGQAKADLNFIRTAAGLAARSNLTPTNILDELLTQKRYSLLFEGGHRWIDLRRYGKLDASHVAVDTPSDVILALFPIPLTETQARQ
jgi:hypothetical protein